MTQQIETQQIEQFVNAPERADRVKQVRSMIDALGVEYLYLQFVSITGRICGKGVPADHWERVAERGFQQVYSAAVNVFSNRHGEHLGYGPEAAEFCAIPEPETFCQLPWDKRVARVFCTLFHNREEQGKAGDFFTGDCRNNLRQIHEAFQKQHNGLHLRLGTEPEMMWLKKDEHGRPAGGVSDGYCSHIEQFERLRPIYMQVNAYARAMGLDMIESDHEDASGMLELNFMYDDCLRTADRLTTYRQICAQVAREFDLIACFMAKPFAGVSACGCHHNLSLWQGGKDAPIKLGQETPTAMAEVFTYRTGGDNYFLPDGDDLQIPSKIGQYAIGGIVAHLDALTAIGCSTVNSYRRLWDTGYWAPVFKDWGYQNRTTGMRISAPGRFEFRSVDSMVNPYLMAAGLLKAMEDGIINKMPCGEPEERNIYEAIDEGKQVEKLPMSLKEALDGLAKDQIIQSAMLGEMYRLYHEYKTDEWERFMQTTTDWDRDTYMDCLP